MYIPSASRIPDQRLVFTPALPLDGAHFTLDIAGVMGVFGGDEAVSAMATVHVYENRRWFGWYNCPGSYQIARRYGLLAKSRFFEGFFPGVRTDPARMFELDGLKGPKFRAAHSGTIIEDTGHLAALLMNGCGSLPGTAIGWRVTQPVGVTIARVTHVPEPKIYPPRIKAHSPIFASFPIAVSVGTCIACGIFRDWYSFSMILLGILTTGISCLVIGSGRFVFNHPKPADGSPPGDGILGSDKEIVLLKGPEGAVNCITRGWFSLEFSSAPEYENIGWCSVLLIIQFVAQLLLIPQGSLFGQIVFIASLAATWVYNLLLSSLDKEKIQREILLNNILKKPVLAKYTLGTRTTMVVFVLLVLQPEEPKNILNALLPNDTRVWRNWKETVVRRLSNKEKLVFAESDWELSGFNPDERKLLESLYKDAQAAYDGYVQYVVPK